MSLCLTLVSLIYIAVFFLIGTVISTYLDNSKTALIIAFTVWVFAVLIIPRVGFITAKFIAPTQTSQSIYLEKTAVRENFNDEVREKRGEIQTEYWKDRPSPSIQEQMDASSEIDKHLAPVETEYRQKFNDSANEIDRRYYREQARQESVAETLSRISPTSSLIYLATNLTRTGKAKRTNYFKAGERYFDALHVELFSKIRDYIPMRIMNPKDNIQLAPPPAVETQTLGETFRQSLVDVLLLCFFAVVLTTVAFLKFFRSDI